jgi:hypothetical protein
VAVCYDFSFYYGSLHTFCSCCLSGALCFREREREDGERDREWKEVKKWRR